MQSALAIGHATAAGDPLTVVDHMLRFSPDSKARKRALYDTKLAAAKP